MCTYLSTLNKEDYVAKIGCFNAQFIFTPTTCNNTDAQYGTTSHNNSFKLIHWTCSKLKINKIKQMAHIK